MTIVLCREKAAEPSNETENAAEPSNEIQNAAEPSNETENAAKPSNESENAAEPSNETETPVVYVTGFSSYWNFESNSSEEAVQLLKETDLEKQLGVRLITDILQVSYKFIDTHVPQMWEKLKPKLVVHVGMSTKHELKMEQQAKNSGYEYNDNEKYSPPKGVCIPGGEELLKSEICMESASSAVNKNQNLKLNSNPSLNPGGFVCGYIYYVSLHQDASRTAFLHVPHIDKNEGLYAKDITAALVDAIKELYQQVKLRDNQK
ncbi:hypothetical protein Pcinc_005603 [Petrolisthes cinctipes]|uniref:Pyroglutamyl-peptidase I n=1 Tax=Petrolisthes cinctipes TaxID=88211 RepID=A0AAE1GER8_PETCI|nr:hypothetical protein Pcinc_005603 [Petrolisthes cinctipes]